MRLYPAIDILEGSAVRLVRGDFAAKRVYDTDPLAAARGWVRDGAEYLHVVDLDGARSGEPVNLDQLRRIVDDVGVPVQYGGGLRGGDAIAAALSAGAARVILGTAAFAGTSVLDDALEAHGSHRVAAAVDVRGGRVATHGWLQDTDVAARDAFAELRDRGVHDFVFTNIDHDGMLDGASREEVETVAAAAKGGSVIFSGGIGGLDDLRALAQLQRRAGLERLAGVIVGTALYEGQTAIAEALAALAED